MQKDTVLKIRRVFEDNQLLQLCMARTVWSDRVIRLVWVSSGKFSTCTVTSEKQRKLN